MKRTLATVALAVVGLMTVGSAVAQQGRQSQRASHGQQQAQPDARPRTQAARPMYQRGDTWYEFLLKQFNPSNFDYGAWIEERRQVFLDESVRNPYFKYSLGTTIALLVMAMLYTKQWIDHRRAMWITAEMMTDLYNHDAYSRGVALRRRSRNTTSTSNAATGRSRRPNMACLSLEQIRMRTTSRVYWILSPTRGIPINVKEI